MDERRTGLRPYCPKARPPVVHGPLYFPFTGAKTLFSSFR